MTVITWCGSIGRGCMCNGTTSGPWAVQNQQICWWHSRNSSLLLRGWWYVMEEPDVGNHHWHVRLPGFLQRRPFERGCRECRLVSRGASYFDGWCRCPSWKSYISVVSKPWEIFLSLKRCGKGVLIKLLIRYSPQMIARGGFGSHCDEGDALRSIHASMQRWWM